MKLTCPKCNKPLLKQDWGAGQPFDHYHCSPCGTHVSVARGEAEDTPLCPHCKEPAVRKRIPGGDAAYEDTCEACGCRTTVATRKGMGFDTEDDLRVEGKYGPMTCPCGREMFVDVEVERPLTVCVKWLCACGSSVELNMPRHSQKPSTPSSAARKLCEESNEESMRGLGLGLPGAVTKKGLVEYLVPGPKAACDGYANGWNDCRKVLMQRLAGFGKENTNE